MVCVPSFCALDRGVGRRWFMIVCLPSFRSLLSCSWCSGPWLDTAECSSLMSLMHDVLGEINVYNIYGPCVMSMDENGKKVSTTHRAPVTGARKTLWDKSQLGGPDGCIDAGAATLYLDHPEVRKVRAPPAFQSPRLRGANPLARDRQRSDTHPSDPHSAGDSCGRRGCGQPAMAHLWDQRWWLLLGYVTGGGVQASPPPSTY